MGHPAELLQPGVFGGEAGEGAPVEVFHAAADGGEGVVVDHAQDRHGDFGAVGGGLHEADVFEAEAHLESGGLVALVGDEAAVGFVHRRGEERVGEQVDEFVRVDAVLASEGDGFAERLDDGADEEIAGEFDDVGHLGLGADDEGALADGVEDGLAALEVGGVRRRRATTSLAAAAASGRPKTGAET